MFTLTQVQVASPNVVNVQKLGLEHGLVFPATKLEGWILEPLNREDSTIPKKAWEGVAFFKMWKLKEMKQCLRM